MLGVACVLQRNALVQRAPTAFEAAFRAYQDAACSASARATFDIATAHKRELAKHAPGQASADDTACAFKDHTASYAAFDSNRRDVRRRIADTLYFVVCDERGRWVFPWRPVRTPESGRTSNVPFDRMRSSAPPPEDATDKSVESCDAPPSVPRRMSLYMETHDLLAAVLGKSWEPYVVGRCPLAVLQQAKQPPHFFMRAHVVGGSMRFVPGAAHTDYAWLTAAELATMLDAPYLAAVSPMLST